VNEDPACVCVCVCVCVCGSRLFSSLYAICPTTHTNTPTLRNPSLAMASPAASTTAAAGPSHETRKELIKQGAEALVYKTTYLLPTIPALLKLRPRKPYRHPTLDLRLTKHRCLSEARLLIRARSLGIPVPAVYFVDETRGEIFMEWIDGSSVRDVLDQMLARDGGEQAVDRIMVRMGEIVGGLHAADIVHGDLTTSNVMVRTSRRKGLLGAQGRGEDEDLGQGEGELLLIDLGLGSVSTAEEDKAVDLYVLERAFLSTHPKAESLFGDVLAAYERSYKGSKPVMRRLQDVRMRGRKRSMIG
jgi:TP53 regulating kinase-like protein